jgi:hypothetical protein
MARTMDVELLAVRTSCAPESAGAERGPSAGEGWRRSLYRPRAGGSPSNPGARDNHRIVLSSNCRLPRARGWFMPTRWRRGPTSCAANIAASPKIATRPAPAPTVAPCSHPSTGTRGVASSKTHARAMLIDTTPGPKTSNGRTRASSSQGAERVAGDERDDLIHPLVFTAAVGDGARRVRSTVSPGRVGRRRESSRSPSMMTMLMMRRWLRAASCERAQASCRRRSGKHAGLA